MSNQRLNECLHQDYYFGMASLKLSIPHIQPVLFNGGTHNTNGTQCTNESQIVG